MCQGKRGEQKQALTLGGRSRLVTARWERTTKVSLKLAKM